LEKKLERANDRLMEV